MPTGRTLNVVGVHCAGEVCDVIVGGVLDVPGKTMFEKMMHMWAKSDNIRHLLMNEPRGSSAMCMNLVLPHCNPEADAGFIIMEHEEYPPYVWSEYHRHGNRLVRVKAECEEGKCKSVEFQNVPAFVFALDLDITVPGFDVPVKVDVAWGGMIYALVNVDSIGLTIEKANGARLVDLGERIKKAVQEQTEFVHPENPDIRGVSILEFTGNLRDEGTHKTSVNTVVVSPGRLDRSPCGTGTCARLAVLHKRGLLAEGETFRHQGILGTEFIGHIRGVAKVGEYDAVIPAIKGTAWITAFKQVILHPTDPFPMGFRRGTAAAPVFENHEDAEPDLASRPGNEAGRNRGARLLTPIVGQVVPSSAQRSDGHDGTSPDLAGMADGQEGSYTPNSDSDDQHLSNPLSTGRSAFSTAGNGFTFYLGTSSNWSFTRRILSMTHERLFQLPLPTDELGFDCMIYELSWGGSGSVSSEPASPVLPSLDHCIYLINAVKFHCCQIFHLFDEESFMESLYAFYDNPLQQPRPSEELWYVHFLLILAFGKVFTTKTAQGKRPPGEAYFSKALHLLPNILMLWTRPVEATEVLCCIALYLQCIDSRIVAHNYIGQAIRLAMGCGLHTDMGTDGFGEALVERSRRVWWTVYILDCEMTSHMGLPQLHHDYGVCPKLPGFLGSPQRTAALSIRIKISRIMAKINDTVYGTHEVFLPFDLDSLFVSTVSAMVAFVLDVRLNENIPTWLQKSYSIFEEFITVGNRVALFRKSELLQLHGLLNSLPTDENSTLNKPDNGGASDDIHDRATSIDDIHNNVALVSTLLPPFSAAADPSGGSDISFENLLTTAEITEMANSIDGLDAEWVSQTILGQCNGTGF
ncbi:hypothetical protein GQX73_g2628 [Xylaria multiplex]|uniref:Xylanolytic transcriptional activator regulatory domain-containing protein n=1 Tax=Xylaria multiplex TaxID=323545 RepID=A0A7C8IS54_9PEZI|nr:hypothetical protein GQX73_g2628 [Xylaria multiplex]